MSLLVERGAEVNKADPVSYCFFYASSFQLPKISKLTFFVYWPCKQVELTALLAAASGSYSEVVDYLLQHGADINCTEKVS